MNMKKLMLSFMVVAVTMSSAAAECDGTNKNKCEREDGCVWEDKQCVAELPEGETGAPTAFDCADFDSKRKCDDTLCEWKNRECVEIGSTKTPTVFSCSDLSRRACGRTDGCEYDRSKRVCHDEGATFAPSQFSCGVYDKKRNCENDDACMWSGSGRKGECVDFATEVPTPWSCGIHSNKGRCRKDLINGCDWDKKQRACVEFDCSIYNGVKGQCKKHKCAYFQETKVCAKITETPSTSPTSSPSETPTLKPSSAPSQEPTLEPSASPSKEPTKEPTSEPSVAPSASPSAAPSDGDGGDIIFRALRT